MDLTHVPVGGGPVDLLEALKTYTLDAVKDLYLPVRVQKDDESPSSRTPDVYKMRLPDSKRADKKAPYILHQFLTSSDVQNPGEKMECSAVVRSIFCAYCEDEQEGALHLLNMMTRFRIPLLANPWLSNGKYELNLQVRTETLVYPDDTAPYYAGEMITNWLMPPVKREVPCLR